MKPSELESLDKMTASESMDWFTRQYQAFKSPHIDEERLKKERDVLQSLWKESGSPYVRQLTPQEFTDTGHDFTQGSPRAFFNTSSRHNPLHAIGLYAMGELSAEKANTSMWNQLGTAVYGEKMREEFPDTLNIQYGDIDDFFAELAHAEQYKSTIDPIIQEHQSYMARLRAGEAVYDYEFIDDIPSDKWGMPFSTGMVPARSKEYEAHQKIEPELIEKYHERMGLNQPKSMSPFRDDRMAEQSVFLPEDIDWEDLLKRTPDKGFIGPREDKDDMDWLEPPRIDWEDLLERIPNKVIGPQEDKDYKSIDNLIDEGLLQ
jgi:hypothetical protein|tara:strand:- start:43 stop:996 length:954 start_codon:yes stop_codon:yes gene_type:complete